MCAYIDAHLGPKPDDGQIDRINNERGYEPGNIRWATSKENNNNRRDNRRVRVAGVTQTAAQWGEERGMPRQVITNRLARGWSHSDAVSVPAAVHVTRVVTFRGKTQTLQQWADELSVPVTTLRHRLDRGVGLLDGVQPVLRNRLLEELKKRGAPVGPTILAREMGEEPPTITTMLHLMARDGLIKKLGRGLYQTLAPSASST